MLDARPGQPGCARRLAPGEQPSLAVVVPRGANEDVSWLASYGPPLPTYIYQPATGKPPFWAGAAGKAGAAGGAHPNLHVVSPASSKGHEAGAYFRAILDLYDDLPDHLLFLHPNRRAWHSQLTNDWILRRLTQWRPSLPEGYAGVNCREGRGGVRLGPLTLDGSSFVFWGKTTLSCCGARHQAPRCPSLALPRSRCFRKRIGTRGSC